MQWPGTELGRSGRFTDIRQITIDRRLVISARDYIGPCRPFRPPSTHRGGREQVFDQILTVLPPQVTLNGDLTLHLARVVKPQTPRRVSTAPHTGP
jgi:hypothetical protein